MSKKIYVTKAQETAARMIVERSAKSGKAVRSSISRIAKASSNGSSQSTVTSRYPSGPEQA